MVLATAAVVVVAAIGVVQGSRWLGIQQPQQAAGEGQLEQPTLVTEKLPEAEQQAAPRAALSAEVATKPRETGRPQAAPRPKPAASKTPARAAAAPAAVPVPAPAAPAPAVVVAPVVAEAPRAAQPEPPSGRIFEANAVEDGPQIVTRVEPQLPADLAAKASNDVVVVRVLVSQTGHPFRVTLLRASRLGRAVDEAVIAAVSQWTFTPARKRGEAVSSWYNIGVPLGRAN